MVVFIVCILATLVLASCGTNPPPHRGLDGYIWLSFSKDLRLGYMYGFKQGITQGYARGCNTAVDLFGPSEPTTPGHIPWAKCLEQHPRYERDELYYADRLTAYYKRFPQDQDRLIYEVLAFFEEPGEIDFEQVHRELSRRR
jgi:hypothetical protein